MYIKEVIIQGFRSYKDQTQIEQFSHKCNVIVGRNGSGKSNFFAAIQFVLSDEFGHLRSDARQGLLHEGTGARVMSAHVEIVFDNSDARLPDAFRLKLLREVAGTRVYDERKEESKGILRDTEGKRDKIDNLLKYIEDRLQTLEEEKEELKEYQKWDKQRRSLEYTIYDHELRDTRRKLEMVAEKREGANAQANELQSTLLTASDAITRLTRQIREFDRKLGALQEKREQLNQEQSEKFSLKTQMDLDVKDIREELEGERSNRNKREDDLQRVKNKIAEKQQRLDAIRPRFAELVGQEQKINTEMLILEQEKSELYAKQGYQERFQSKEERDQWLQRQIRQVDRQIRETSDQLTRLRNELEAEEQKQTDEQRVLLDASQELEEQKGTMEAFSREHTDLKKQRDELHGKRNMLWQEERDLAQEIAQMNDEIHTHNMTLRSMTGKVVLSYRGHR